MYKYAVRCNAPHPPLIISTLAEPFQSPSAHPIVESNEAIDHWGIGQWAHDGKLVLVHGTNVALLVNDLISVRPARRSGDLRAFQSMIDRQ